MRGFYRRGVLGHGDKEIYLRRGTAFPPFAVPRGFARAGPDFARAGLPCFDLRNETLGSPDPLRMGDLGLAGLGASSRFGADFFLSGTKTPSGKSLVGLLRAGFLS